MFQKSFTLIEVLVGIALILIVFLGIFGAYQLGLKVVGLSGRKITATQIAQGEIEKIRNLPYLAVGTVGAQLPYASGILEPSTSTILNGIEYQIERKIKFVIDPADGTGPEDSCNLDYKKVEIKVSWGGRFSGEVKMITDVAPKNKIEEIQTCTQQPGGILSVSVFDAQGILVPSPLIEIFDPSSGSLIDSATPFNGKHDFPLATSTYKVVVSKSGYSSERTYGTDEIAIPEKPNPIVLEGQVTQISFSIDKLSSFLVKTLSPWGEAFFLDSFSDESKVSEKENVLISGGKATLATTSEGYYPSGYLFSIEISPSDLLEWDEFSFSHEEPAGTDLKYQIYYASGTEWLLIPDSDLPGNSVGFDSSPIDISSLSTTTYSILKLKANFSTASTSSTPILFGWQVSWKTSLPTPIGNVKFNLRGKKLIGKDANENPVYKFSTTTMTDSSGKIQIPNLEWDIYYFSDFQKDSQSLDLVTSTPSHPVSLNPDTNLEVNFYLESQNSLLVTVLDSDTLNPIFSATVTTTKPGYQATQSTGEKGQTLFIPLEEGNYTILVEAPGYYSTSTTVYVSGKTATTIRLAPSD